VYNWETFKLEFYFKKINGKGLSVLPKDLIEEMFNSVRCDNCEKPTRKNLRIYNLNIVTDDTKITYSLLICDECMMRISEHYLLRVWFIGTCFIPNPNNKARRWCPAQMTANDNLSIFNVNPKNPRLKNLRNILIELGNSQEFQHYEIVCPFAYASIKSENNDRFMVSKHFTDYALRIWASSGDLINCWDVIKLDTHEWLYEESLRRRCEIKYNWETGKWSWQINKKPGEVFKLDIRKIAPRIHCLSCDESNISKIRGYPLSIWFKNHDKTTIRNKLMLCDTCISRETTLAYSVDRHNQYQLHRVFAYSRSPPGTSCARNYYSDSDDSVDESWINRHYMVATECVMFDIYHIEDDELRILHKILTKIVNKIGTHFTAELEIPFDHYLSVNYDTELHSGVALKSANVKITKITNPNIKRHIATWNSNFTKLAVKREI
jgi:hypothetical protein